LKPDVILFGEMLPTREIQAAQREAADCDLMLVVGSSLEVTPVADLPKFTRHRDARLIIVNFSETYADDWADVVIHADVAEVLPKLAAPFSA
jgi:NAD-dependent deacetylase